MSFKSQKKRKKIQGRKKILEKIMTENFPYLAKKAHINLKIQEVQQTLNRKKKKKKQNLKEMYAQMHHN